MKRLKALLGWAAFRSGLYRPFFRNKALVVLFHRIDDGLRGNPISCTRREFEDFCDFFRAHFTVVSLGELLDKLDRGEDVSRHLVITFDDGYLDNHDIAAAELARRGLPACFFIATEFIASDRVPWWDAERGIKSRWMDWDQVRALGRQGFELGAHTMNHVDLGVVTGAEARREIVGSRERLQRETGRAVPFFSYPYGRRHQLTEENREEVRRAGFRCCLSAHGGVVRPGDGAFALRRLPISPWYVSPFQFGLEVMLER